MGTRDLHPQSSGAPHVWLAWHRIIRKAAEIPSTTAERFENSCCSLRASRNANNRFCDAAFAAPGYAEDTLTCVFRIASTDAGFSSADVSPRFSLRYAARMIRRITFAFRVFGT